MRYIRSNFTVRAIACLVLAAAPAACGDSETETGGGEDLAAPPSAPQVVAPSSLVASTWEREHNLHFCGPASARIALSARLASPPTQEEIAAFLDWDHLGNCFVETCPDGVRDLAHVAAAMNHYLDTDRYQPTYLSTPPTAEEGAELRRRVVAGIAAGFPLLVFVYGPSSDEEGAFLPSFYPADGPPHHFLTVVGYEQNGDAAVISDSASGDSDVWGAFPETYSVPMADLAKWIGYHGYAG